MMAKGGAKIFESHESNVRTYCRSFPTVFVHGKNALLYDEEEKRYIDFFAGGGALNYGHNPDWIKARLLEFLHRDGVAHALDMYTSAKREFLEGFVNTILAPRRLDYKVQFCGPTGANAVEAALKLARLYTGRTTVCAFSGGWHGMTSGCLSVTGNRDNRRAAGFPLPCTFFLPFPEGPYPFADSMRYIETMFADPNSGWDTPAAVIVETIQAEGGINIAPVEWLQALRRLCDCYNVLLIVDEVQVGCGRSGPFFSFERAGIEPDIVCLAKSIGGYGLPMALTLFKRSLDVWKPGQHTGTFRGNQMAFVAGKAALDVWEDDHFSKETQRKGKIIKEFFECKLPPGAVLRGMGMIWGVDMTQIGGADIARKIAKGCFDRGLIIERCGRDDTVLKIMPPLTIEDDILEEGCQILYSALQSSG